MKEGPRIVTFTSAPELVFPQAGQYHGGSADGILRYDMALGAGMSLIFLKDGLEW